MRRTNASLIYRRTKNTRAVQILLGPTKLESTESPMVSWIYPNDCFWSIVLKKSVIPNCLAIEQ